MSLFDKKPAKPLKRAILKSQSLFGVAQQRKVDKNESHHAQPWHIEQMQGLNASATQSRSLSTEAAAAAEEEEEDEVTRLMNQYKEQAMASVEDDPVQRTAAQEAEEEAVTRVSAEASSANSGEDEVSSRMRRFKEKAMAAAGGAGEEEDGLTTATMVPGGDPDARSTVNAPLVPGGWKGTRRRLQAIGTEYAAVSSKMDRFKAAAMAAATPNAPATDKAKVKTLLAKLKEVALASNTETRQNQEVNRRLKTFKEQAMAAAERATLEANTIEEVDAECEEVTRLMGKWKEAAMATADDDRKEEEEKEEKDDDVSRRMKAFKAKVMAEAGSNDSGGEEDEVSSRMRRFKEKAMAAAEGSGEEEDEVTAAMNKYKADAMAAVGRETSLIPLGDGGEGKDDEEEEDEVSRQMRMFKQNAMAGAGKQRARKSWKCLKSMLPAGHAAVIAAHVTSKVSADRLEAAIQGLPIGDCKSTALLQLAEHYAAMNEKEARIKDVDEHNRAQTALSEHQSTVSILPEGEGREEAEGKLEELQHLADSARKRWHYAGMAHHENSIATMFGLKSKLEAMPRGPEKDSILENYEEHKRDLQYVGEKLAEHPESHKKAKSAWHQLRTMLPAGHSQAVAAHNASKRSSEALKQSIRELSWTATHGKEIAMEKLSQHETFLQETSVALNQVEDYARAHRELAKHEDILSSIPAGPGKEEATDRLEELQARADSSRKRWLFASISAHEYTRTSLLGHSPPFIDSHHPVPPFIDVCFRLCQASRRLS